MATAAVASLARSTQPLPLYLLGNAAEPSVALLIVRQGFEELRLSKIRPQRLGNVNFGVGALPQEEVRQAHFATGPDQQIRIRHAGGVEETAENALVDRLG